MFRITLLVEGFKDNLGCINSEDGGKTLLRNVCYCLPINEAS